MRSANWNVSTDFHWEALWQLVKLYGQTLFFWGEDNLFQKGTKVGWEAGKDWERKKREQRGRVLVQISVYMFSIAHFLPALGINGPSILLHVSLFQSCRWYLHFHWGHEHARQYTWILLQECNTPMLGRWLRS